MAFMNDCGIFNVTHIQRQRFWISYPKSLSHTFLYQMFIRNNHRFMKGPASGKEKENVGNTTHEYLLHGIINNLPI